jgi:hypothetical protein
MKINRLDRQINEQELIEILQIARDEETKFKTMSNFATITAEKWRIKTQKLEHNRSKIDSNERTLEN